MSTRGAHAHTLSVPSLPPVSIGRTPSGERHGLRSRDDLFDDLRGPDDRRALANLLLGDPTGLRAGTAEPDLTAVVHELRIEVAEHGKPLLGDALGASLGTEPRRVDRAEHDSLLSCGRRDVRRHEWQRGALRIRLAVRAVEDQLVAHRPRSTVIRSR